MSIEQARIGRRAALATGCVLALHPMEILAQTPYPSKPIKLIVQFVPGGNVDTFARLLAVRLSAKLGQPVTVENRGGANGAVAYQGIATAQKDGYTLGIAHIAQLAINPHLLKNSSYKAEEFVLIARLVDAPNVLAVHPSVGAKTLKEFIALAKQNPGQLSLGHAGVGTVGHLSGGWLEKEAGIDFLQVPYKGSGQVLNDLIGGQVKASFGSLPSFMPSIEAGKLRAIAVTTNKRLPAYPNIPTVAESGFPGYHAVAWLGLLGPAGLPASVVSALERAAIEVISAPDARATLDTNGFILNPANSEEFARFVKTESQSWGKVVAERGYKAD
jgi:tripartite-type tricarboxylate transporter receptor subunit TctC